MFTACVLFGLVVVVVMWSCVVLSSRISRVEERRAARGGGTLQVRPEVELGAEEVVDPVSIEGSCAYCPCGERVEMPAAVTSGADGARVRCPGCVRILRIPPRPERGSSGRQKGTGG